MSDLYWLPVAADWGDRLATARNQTGEAAWAELVQLARTRLDFTKTERLARVVTRLFGNEPPAGLAAPPVRLALLGSSTVEHLIPAIRVAGLRRNMWIEVYTGAYGQYFHELADPGSALHAFNPNVVLFAQDARHLVSAAAATRDGNAAEQELRSVIGRLDQAWSLARGLGAHVLQQNAMPVFPALIGSNEHRLAWSPRALVDTFNAMLRDQADASGVDIVSLTQAVEHHGLSTFYDPALWYRAKQEIHPLVAPLYGDLVGRAVAARFGRSSKCLVLDLDNTLWGGVIGDDGLEGIVLGQGNAVGEAHLALQAYAHDLSSRGVILAVCSKNDEANALEAFEKHPEMKLRRGDIACFIANWQDKATNLREIARQLNIGIDSLVFVDDNPFERNIIRRELPMVEVPELPEDPTTYVNTVADAGYFEASTVTADDAQRASQYQANAQRDAAKAQVTDVASYLQSLSMEMLWRPFDGVGASRVAQLINKSNQFNLTTRRYSDAEVQALIGVDDTITLQLRLTDTFGDNGMISVIIARPSAADPAIAEIDTWLMSCRVLGRGVEQAALNLLAELAREAGFAGLRGTYIPSAKNSMVAEHYRKLGFAEDGAGDEGTTYWMLDLAAYQPHATYIATIKE
ncbi:HAD-IIIC family phosphatase [Sphingomonas nostoxanthinifaciens]|uniref:HAD-IIIC family phosphatase n=1 Tax=Sphingomonas nostoxanthinifaciens TaxID=2872652 RepID=UPI001CC1CBFF|nr:HAD-IIIC family phosphatase [Sphingomonas nostoxanthinifaciens]UAK25059.1 HAD-IIIC family phosphatase [Sphingomonas nostoxanthinifaciens]